MGLGWCLSRRLEQVWQGTLELKEAAEADEVPWEAFPDAVEKHKARIVFGSWGWRSSLLPAELCRAGVELSGPGARVEVGLAGWL